jgi:hypothetical protein
MSLFVQIDIDIRLEDLGVVGVNIILFLYPENGERGFL